ncbi:MAG TPA: TIGR00159 family protein [Lachnospiraceae bacterium]|nr:diadenylate cyclase CdaA [Lachnospiraceae bacterium]HAP72908.1 TIGR00159 family protein [Lachnospiraceae bacterium]HBH70820.1 TIGR00159 family protein [Lachnospiraceae bacterium]
MQILQTILFGYLKKVHIPSVRWTDIVEILIIAFLVYHIMLWVKNTRAWSLLRGFVVIIVFIFFAAVFNMTTILWIVQNVMSIAVIAIVVILQPELRNAMEELGRKNLIASLFRIDSRTPDGLYSDHTIAEIVRACTDMAKVKTGALIVIERKTPLNEYEKTGIDIDAVVSSQLLVNIFQKNTPLHDGAVLIRRDRVVSATCYLPLSDNKLDKNLGTRHRAGVGISEVTDSLTIIVSEETGQISAAYRGTLDRNLDASMLRAKLVELQNKQAADDRRGIIPPWRGRKNEQ